MKTNESFIQDLKLNLMDVVLNDHSYNRTEQVKQLLKEIEKAPFIEQVDIAVQSTNVVSKSLKIYSLHQRQLMSDEDLATYLNNEVESLNQTKNLFIAELEEDNLFKARSEEHTSELQSRFDL